MTHGIFIALLAVLAACESVVAAALVIVAINLGRLDRAVPKSGDHRRRSPGAQE
jgi:hypothetical protein